MLKAPNLQYTPEFRTAAVKRLKDGQSIGVVARELGMSGQTLRTRIKDAESGRASGSGAKVITPEQMEMSRLRADVKRLTTALGIAKKAAAYFVRNLL
jgi:transposase